MVVATKAEPIAAARIASRFAPRWCGSFAPKVMAIEIEPGPTVKGSVNGKNASRRTSVPLTVRPTASRSFSSFFFNIAQPVAITIIPPPTWTTGSEIPKNESTWDPMVKDATSNNDRIHDREQSAHDQQNALGNLKEHAPPSRESTVDNDEPLSPGESP